MTAQEFEAMVRARGLPASASREALRQMLVEGMPVAQAARAVGCTYAAA